jgi:shikimate kinase
MIPDPQIVVRRSFQDTEHTFLIGPGGVGKSTLGAAIAPRLNRPLVDLDLEFCDRIGTIGPYIAAEGYPAYRQANLDLALQLVGALSEPSIFVTASGFLAAEPQSDDYRAASALIATGYAITLLPTLDLARATDIVVERQMRRGFTFDRAGETEKFRHRFYLYRDKGDMLVLSTQPASQVATAVVAALHGHPA